MCKIYRYHWSHAWTFRLLDGLLSGSDVHVEPHPSGCLQAEARGDIALNMLLNKIVAKRYPIGLVALPLPLHMQARPAASAATKSAAPAVPVLPVRGYWQQPAVEGDTPTQKGTTGSSFAHGRCQQSCAGP